MLPFTVAQIVEILYRNDGKYLLHPFDIGDVYFGEPDEPDLAGGSGAPLPNPGSAGIAARRPETGNPAEGLSQ